MQAVAKGSIEGWRWVGMRSFLFDASLTHKVSLSILNEEKCFLSTVIHFSLEGEESRVRQCIENIRSVIRRHHEF